MLSRQDSTNRLERILELVTDHERQYRDQDIRLADVVQRMSELELRLSHATEWAPLWALKERNVPMELDLARTAVETVVRQLAAVTKTNQVLQAELKSSQQRQAAQQIVHDSAMAVLQADTAALRNRLDDVQANGKAALEQLRSSLRDDMEQHRVEVQEQLQSMERELMSKHAQGLHAATSKATTAVRELEAWTKAEMLQLASKLKAVVQSCSNHQQQVNLQMEALQQQWDNTTAAMEVLQQEDKRVRKHVARLQQQSEELQQASQQAASQAATLQQLQDELQHLAATQQQLTMQVEAAGSSSDTLSRQVQGMSHSVQQLEAQLAAHVTDAVAMAECMAGCMAAARAQASSSPPASSYLSTLLGPAVAPPVAAAGTAKRQEAWGAWDANLAQLSGLVSRMRRHHHHQPQAACSSCTSQTLQGSPVRGGLGARKQQQQW